MELTTSHYILLQGHALDVLRTLPDNSVHCVNTSSPYYGLRSYGTEPVVWAAPDGAPLCEDGRHEWMLTPPRRTRYENDAGNGINSFNGSAYDAKPQNQCVKCGCWRGELGQEPTPQLFIAHLVSVFREVRRVLRNDGVCFANIADSWARQAGDDSTKVPDNGAMRTGRTNKLGLFKSGNNKPPSGIPSKSAMLIPERFVIALQDDGWIVRMPIVWAKGISLLPNYAGSVMPESVTDRPTKSYEMIYMLAKSARYYWDKWAVAEQSTFFEHHNKYHTKTSGRIENNRNADNLAGDNGGLRGLLNESDGTRNLRSVWAINPEPSSLKHYAMQPSKIAETVIRAGTSERGVCSTCGAPWVRVTKRTQVGERDDTGRTHSTIDWRPSCACPAAEPVPATVLDPFSGAGTTGVVAKRLGRDYIGIELKEEYIAIAREHIDSEPDPLFVAESHVQAVSDESLEQLAWTLDT